MNQEQFYHSGKVIYRFRWAICILWLLLLLGCLPILPHIMSPYKSADFLDPNSESHQASKIMNDKLGYNYNNFIVMYESSKPFDKNPQYLQEIKSSLAPLADIKLQHEIMYPDMNPKQISKDNTKAYAVIVFKNSEAMEHDDLVAVKSAIKQPANLKMSIGGQPIFADDTKKQTQIDLYKAEYIGTPAAIITMLLVFGSVVAASLPVILGGVCALIILSILYFAGHYISLSVFTVNIALLLGLCLSLDYSLFIVSRFREELKKGHEVSEAIAITQMTAGQAVFFSGLAVFISLSSLLFFRINVLFSVGVGGLAAVGVAVAISIILLPAILGILNHRINYFTIIKDKKTESSGDGMWRRFVAVIVRNRIFFFTIIMAVLLIMSYPFFHVKIGISDYRILPKAWESRQVFDEFKNTFGENQLTPIIILVKSSNAKIVDSSNLNAVYDFSRQLKQDPRVSSVSSIVDIQPGFTKQQYEMLYGQPQSHLNPAIKKLLAHTTNDNITTITVTSKFANDSAETKSLVKDIRHIKLNNGLTIQVTGVAANTIDVLDSIAKTFIYAFIWTIAFTYLILLVLLRSVVLPVKAIIMNILSLCASYGILVFVFQYGYFHEFLHFEPQGMIDITLIVIIFCALFGFSMDYEVFLLSRIKEDYEESGNNLDSIGFGIEHSSKIITSAAIIVILICFSFMFADVLMVKAFGLGIAVAIFVDAFLIRTVLVPVVMAILGDWNWYLPKWLDNILPHISFHTDER